MVDVRKKVPAMEKAEFARQLTEWHRELAAYLADGNWRFSGDKGWLPIEPYRAEPFRFAWSNGMRFELDLSQVAANAQGAAHYAGPRGLLKLRRETFRRLSLLIGHSGRPAEAREFRKSYDPKARAGKVEGEEG